MESKYYILLSLKNTIGYECFGQYFLGDDKDHATGIFSELKGKPDISEQAMLHMDFVETLNGLPARIKTICCTLDEFTCNCKFIAKEIFRLNSLKELISVI